MASKKVKSEQKPDTQSQKTEKTTLTVAKKGWRIFRFKQRFELPDDIKICRKSGLQFTRDFVSAAGGDEAVGYLNQFSMLSNGDGLELCMLQGLYRRLVNMAASHSKAKRGYLLGPSDEPLSDAQIGKLVSIKAPQMRKLLHKFASVELLEKVELPDFDFSMNEQPAKEKGEVETKAKAGAEAKAIKDKKKSSARKGSENSESL